MMRVEDLMRLAHECETPEAAEAVLRSVEGLRWTLPWLRLKADARTIIGYWTGYMDRPDAQRICRLFSTEHYAFESTEKMTTAQLLLSGLRLAQRTDDPECRMNIQRWLDAHDFAAIRNWLRTDLPGDDPWPN